MALVQIAQKVNVEWVRLHSIEPGTFCVTAEGRLLYKLPVNYKGAVDEAVFMSRPVEMVHNGDLLVSRVDCFIEWDYVEIGKP